MGDELKQVIVIRKDLKMRRGKEIAQGAHASMAFMRRGILIDEGFTEDQLKWMDDGQKKICVVVNSERELMELAHKASLADIACHVITDAGHTEFGGVPTKTCLALGPDLASVLDKLTGDLKLY